jgi:hypothetical protein
MSWIYWVIVVAALVHVIEEYFYPGGFLNVVKRLSPRCAAGFTMPFAVVFNGLFILLCVAGALLVGKSPFFSLSVAGLLGINALVHTLAAVRVRGYAAGLVSSWLLYVPLAVIAYVQAGVSGRFTTAQLLGSLVFGAVFNALPVAYLAATRRLPSVHGSKAGKK